MELVETISEAELLDENGNVIEIIQGDVTINRRLAMNFLALFLVLSSAAIFPAEREVLTMMTFFTKPFVQALFSTLIAGLVYGIYRKIKYRTFFPSDRRLFLITIWRFLSIFYLIGFTILLVFAILTNTYW